MHYMSMSYKPYMSTLDSVTIVIMVVTCVLIALGPCDDDNGDCSQLCFPHRAANGIMGRICECAFPFYLDKDGTTCLSGEKF